MTSADFKFYLGVALTLVVIIPVQLWIARSLTFALAKFKPRYLQVLGVTLAAYALNGAIALAIQHSSPGNLTALRGLLFWVGIFFLALFHTKIRSQEGLRLSSVQALAVAFCQIIGGVMALVVVVLILRFLKNLI